MALQEVKAQHNVYTIIMDKYHSTQFRGLKIYKQYEANLKIVAKHKSIVELNKTYFSSQLLLQLKQYNVIYIQQHSKYYLE